MDPPFDFDGVKIEKANAIARYRFFKYISTLFKLFAVLTFISWSSTRLPAAVKSTGECLSACLSNSHAVFLLGNLLIFALYVLSRHPDKSGSENHADTSFQVVDSPEHAEKQQQQKPLAEDSTGDENAVVAVPEMMESEPPAASKEVERFQRTRSEKSLKREEAPPPNRELRRSVTERRLSVEVLNSGDRHDQRPRKATTEFETVDRLSNEEFRLAVEEFISKQRTELSRKLF